MFLQGRIVYDNHAHKSWEIVQKTGEGSCCDVFHAVARDKGVADRAFKVALKVFKDGYDEVFERVRKIHSTLTNQYIVSLRECFVYKDFNIMTEEWLDFSLTQVQLFTGDKGMSLFMVQLLVEHMCRALEYVHGCGYVHGDVKPSNFMWSAQSGCLKLIDFGLTFIYTSQPNWQIQSKPYRAPEVTQAYDIAASHSVLDSGIKTSQVFCNAVDMWSVGCVLFWILTNQRMIDLATENMSVCENCKLENEGDSMAKCKYSAMVEIYIRNRKPGTPDTFIHLITSLLQCVPHKRPSGSDVLKSSFITEKIAAAFEDLVVLPTKILRLLNMLTEEDLQCSDEEFTEIVDDIKDECLRHGDIDCVDVPRQGDGRGKVYVRYQQASSAETAFRKLNGRIFNGNVVFTTYYPVCRFDNGLYS